MKKHIVYALLLSLAVSSLNTININAKTFVDISAINETNENKIREKSTVFSILIDEEDIEKQNYNIQNFCVMFHKNVFRNEYDTNFVKQTVELAKKNNMTGIDIAYNILFSEKAQEKYNTDEDFINLCYQCLANTTPTEADMEKWKDALNIGMSKEYVFASLANSEFYSEICDSYEMPRGKYNTINYRDQRYETTKQMYSFYEKFYNRTPTIQELEKLCYKYIHNKSLEEISFEFIESEEFNQTNITNENYIKNMYQLFLGRNPNSNEINSAIINLNTKIYDKKGFLQNLFQSKEYLSYMKLGYMDVISFGDVLASAKGIEEEKTYQYLLAKDLGIKSITYQNGAKTISTAHSSDSLIDEAQKLPYSDEYSLVLIGAGINDFVSGTIIGDDTNISTDTLYGSLNKLLHIVRDKMPNAEIIVLSPTRCIYSGEINSIGITLDDFNEKMCNIALKSGFEYIDLYNNPNLQFDQNIQKYTTNGLHLNETAHKLIAEELKKILDK